MNGIRAVLVASLLLLIAGCDSIDNPVGLGPAVYGTVTDAATSKPVEGATVTVAGNQSTTAVNGNYYVADVPRGTHTLKVTKAGYTAYSADVTVDSGLVNRNVQLTK